jgi:hypothetical protein
MRRALQDQLRALDQVTSLSSREAARRDVVPPSSASKPAASARAFGGDPGPRNGGGEGSHALSSLSQSLASEMRARKTRPTGAQSQGGNPPSTSQEDRDGWSLGDLLARASREEDGGLRRSEPAALPPAARGAGVAPFSLDIAVIARALDAGAANAIWSRVRAGQRGIMVRSIYTAEGRSAFDEVSRRYVSDPNIHATIDRYLADFEAILREADQKDPSGRLALTHGISDTGRVYLFLAHASGRLS